ncbi:transcription factor bHLH68-like isoform X2 [Hordeum vulgare subsp. vulgare]|uniref:transcription factor bHLH68-like isoform X2 n=1 Tax=Hordeum vulgare subsp. vulgare TaxID=112509 RepID=UPI001D1A4F85|nr:transcription factor bHLH68-like isoform X2 [Hordeum vulgare subsp. vulgare]
MDRGLVHGSSPLVGEMGEGHGWRSMNNLRPPFEQNNPSVSLASTSTSICSSPINSFSSLLLSNHYPLPTNSTAPWHDSSNSNQVLQLQDPWNHFMATNGQLANDEVRHKALEGQALFPATTTGEGEEGDGSSAAGHIYSNTARHGSSLAGDEFQLAMSSPSPWSRGVQHYHNTLQQQASSITSTTSLGNNMLDFSNNGSPRECTSTASGAAFKKARTQEPSPAQSTVKVRKEKLGDRITALHQLVSPFGKTDTASVLLEAIGYIRFLHGQIEVQQRERSSIFPEEPGQLLHGNATRKRGAPDQEDGDGGEEAKNDLRSRGLCLIPLSCAPDFGADVGPADYWTVAPPFGMGFGR